MYSSKATPADVLGLCEALNPEREPGRLTLISRMGVSRVREVLPPLLAAVRDAEHPVVWVCDPMHGNTITSLGGRKTRDFDDVMGEVSGFFAAHAAEGTWPGGVHVELTGDDVRLIEDVNADEGVRWLFSFLSADRRRSYCLYEAPSSEEIMEAARRANVPADEVIEVDRVQPELVR